MGKYLEVDSTVIRLAFVLLLIFAGTGVLLYLIMWLIMPYDN